MDEARTQPSDLDLLVPTILDQLRGLPIGSWPASMGHHPPDHRAGARGLPAPLGDARVTRLGRPYFFAAAARAMRQVLIDAARRRKAEKRGGGVAALSLDEAVASVEAYADELLELDDALRRLEARNPRHARVVECRYFGGMSVEDTAKALNVSPRTVKADWALARAWLYEELGGDAA